MGQISIARGVVAIDPTSAPGVPLYTDVTSPQVLYSGTSGLISGSAKFQWINSTSSLEFGTGAEIYLYNTADQTTDYERGVAKWDTNAYVIGTEKGGTGSARTLNFQVDGTSRWYITTAGHFLTTSSNGYDIGASGSLVRSLYYGTNLDGASGATFNLYNTADQTTNYERLRAEFISNTARVVTQQAGTGTQRGLVVGLTTASNSFFAGMSVSGGAPFVRLGLAGNSSATSSAIATDLAYVNFTGSSGTQTGAQIAPTINQSGTAGYTALDVNPTETATGSGTKLLQRWAVGGTTVGHVASSGLMYINALTAVSSLGLASSIGVTTDITLLRDAADTLALRRGTNAQTFRVYNTYTDGSNYERVSSTWSGSIFYLVTEQAGTGTARSMAIGTTGVASLSFLTSNSSRWQMSSAGHFIATTDNSYDIGSSGANRPRNLYLANNLIGSGYIRCGIATVAGLAAAAGWQQGRLFVSDSTVAAAGNFGNIVAGGGANIVPVYSDGTNWRIG